jgi:hypothetical protein
MHQDMQKDSSFGRRLEWVALLLLLMLYSGYILFAAANGEAAVDYHTFMEIGQRFIDNEPIWVTNSYYPLPTVLIFAFFALLPLPLSIALWHGLPVLMALYATRFRAWVLMFAPLFAHVVGGQSSIFGLVGLYGYRRYATHWRGGIFLAILTFKPQLALVPLAWAGWQWLETIRTTRRMPDQLWAFMGGVVLIYGPTLLLIPDWPVQWLEGPRPLFERALAGFMPRTLLVIFGESGPLFWVVWLLITGVSLVWLVRQHPDFDRWMLWSFVVYPLVHDYDLIQMIPLLQTARLRRVAVIASLPTWVVIFLAYGNDSAWYVVTLIPLATFIAAMWRRSAPVLPSTPDSPAT